VFISTVWSMRASSQDIPDDALVVEVIGTNGGGRSTTRARA